MRVLLVDDEPASLRLVSRFLTSDGYEVLQATNGREALKIVLEEAPPLIVTDWVMPDMDGLQLCRALREHEAVRFVYILMMTAHSDIERLVEAFNAGADDFLKKPINRLELSARLRAGERIARLEEDNECRMRQIQRLNALTAMTNQKLEEANAKLQQMATTDELTGLMNRREGMRRLRELWAARQRYGLVFSCIMLDLDHFKAFNDTYGHAAGDMVLRQTAAILRENVRVSDLICRVGGEEFLVLCPHTSAEGGKACAEHLRAAVQNHEFVYEGQQLKVTVSVGVARVEAHMKLPNELLRRADEALYAAKAAGRNRVVLANAAAAPAPVGA